MERIKEKSVALCLIAMALIGLGSNVQYSGWVLAVGIFALW